MSSNIFANVTVQGTIFASPRTATGIVQGSNAFVFSNASGYSNVMVMNSLGQVGIGTANPGSPLTVNSTLGQGPSATLSLSDSSTKSLQVLLNAGAGNYNGIVAAGDTLFTTGTLVGDASASSMAFGPWSSSALGMKIAGTSNVIGLYSNATTFYSNASPSGAAVMTLTNGRVGIGAAIPGYQFNVTSNIYNDCSGGGFYGMNCGNLSGLIQGVYNGGSANPDGQANSDMFIGVNYNQQTGQRLAGTNHGVAQIQLVGGNAQAGALKFRCLAAGTGAVASIPTIMTIAPTVVNVQTTAAGGRTDLYGDAIEIGAGRTADGSALIDFHAADGTYSDFASRIVRYSGANGTTEFVHRGTGNLQFYGQDNSAITFCTASTERMRITYGGSVGIGTNNPAGQLVVNQSSTAAVIIGGNTNWSGSSGVLKITGTSGLYAAIGTTFGTSTGNDNHWELVNGNGQVGAVRTNGGTTTYNSLSDYRTKTNVQPLSNALATISKMKPVKFNFKFDLNKDVEGFIAHELQECAPNAVSGEKDAVHTDGSINPQVIDMSFLVPFIVAGVQELSAQNTTLEQSLASATANVKSLEAQLATLSERLSALEQRLAASEL